MGGKLPAAASRKGYSLYQDCGLIHVVCSSRRRQGWSLKVSAITRRKRPDVRGHGGHDLRFRVGVKRKS